MINWESLSEMEVIVPMLLRTKNAETSTQMSSVLFLPASKKKISYNILQYITFEKPKQSTAINKYVHTILGSNSDVSLLKSSQLKTSIFVYRLHQERH